MAIDPYLGFFFVCVYVCVRVRSYCFTHICTHLSGNTSTETLRVFVCNTYGVNQTNKSCRSRGQRDVGLSIPSTMTLVLIPFLLLLFQASAEASVPFRFSTSHTGHSPGKGRGCGSKADLDHLSFHPLVLTLTIPGFIVSLPFSAWRDLFFTVNWFFVHSYASPSLIYRLTKVYSVCRWQPSGRSWW